MIGWPTDRPTGWEVASSALYVSGTLTHSFNDRNRGEPNACFRQAISKSRDQPDKLQPDNQRSVKILATPTALTVAKIGVGPDFLECGTPTLPELRWRSHGNKLSQNSNCKACACKRLILFETRVTD